MWQQFSVNAIHYGDNGRVDMLTFQGQIKDTVMENNIFYYGPYSAQIIKFDPLYSAGGNPKKILVRINLLYRTEDVVGYMILVQGAKDVPIYNNLTDTSCYQLKTGSPAVNAADPDFTPAEDILGNSRDANPDIGLHELIE